MSRQYSCAKNRVRKTERYAATGRKTGGDEWRLATAGVKGDGRYSARARPAMDGGGKAVEYRNIGELACAGGIGR